jgi:phospholipid/cholesterol/gamma-HCH transport system substrate-binding protein
MERNAHYALVGLISLLLFVGLIVFVVWLARLQFTQQYSVYNVDFKGPVRGLSSGGEVYFNGIKIGEVTKLSLDQRNPNRVVARIRVSGDAPVRVDSVATLEPLGITGVNYIQISAGTVSRPLLKNTVPANVIPTIRSAQSQLEGLLQGGGTVLARTVEALDRVNTLLSDQNIRTVSQTLTNVRDVTQLIKDQRGLLADADATLKSIDATSRRIAVLSDSANNLVNGDGRRTLASFADAAQELKAATVDVRSTIAGLKGPTADFATNGLPQFTRSLVTLQQAAESLNRLVGEVETNGAGLVTKPPARQLEVQP